MKFMNATMSLDQKKHFPVMLNQVLSIISPQHGGVFVDCTFGAGGYTNAILKYLNTEVIALDRDYLTKQYAEKIKLKYPTRFKYFNKKFSDLKEVLKSKIKPRAIIFDLGISSMQIDDLHRGFSFKSKKSISMEMGINKNNAYDVVNTLDQKELTNIIRILGDEKEAKKIANRIVNYREKKAIETSEELSQIINKAKKKYSYKKINPATKTFQALRIFVNKELTELMLGLIAATEALAKDGILIIVSFHSTEDKIVKYFFNLYSNLKKNPSRYLPVIENKNLLDKVLKNKALIPDRKELITNNRSRSAKLRYAIRNNNDFFYPKEFIKKFESYSKIEGSII